MSSIFYLVLFGNFKPIKVKFYWTYQLKEYRGHNNFIKLTFAGKKQRFKTYMSFPQYNILKTNSLLFYFYKYCVNLCKFMSYVLTGLYFFSTSLLIFAGLISVLLFLLIILFTGLLGRQWLAVAWCWSPWQPEKRVLLSWWSTVRRWWSGLCWSKTSSWLLRSDVKQQTYVCLPYFGCAPLFCPHSLCSPTRKQKKNPNQTQWNLMSVRLNI